MRTAATVLRPRPDVRFRRIDTDGVVLVQGTAQVLGLNEVGARLLELVSGGATVAELVERLAEEYDVERGVLEADVDAFLDRLLSAGVVEAVEGTGRGAAAAEGTP